MNPEKPSRMSHAADIREELHDGLIKLAGLRAWSDTRESWLARAARKAGIPPRTARAIFYREIKDPKWSVVAAIRSALRERDVRDEQIEREAANELATLRARLSALEARADMARETPDRWGAGDGVAGELNRAVDQGEG